MKGGDSVNTNLLKAEMVKRGINGQNLSSQIGISESAFYRKLNGTSEFTINEMKDIARVLNMDHEAIIEVFFADQVS